MSWDYEVTCPRCGRLMDFEGDDLCRKCLSRERYEEATDRKKICNPDGKRLPKQERPKGHPDNPDRV